MQNPKGAGQEADPVTTATLRVQASGIYQRTKD